MESLCQATVLALLRLITTVNIRHNQINFSLSMENQCILKVAEFPRHPLSKNVE